MSGLKKLGAVKGEEHRPRTGWHKTKSEHFVKQNEAGSVTEKSKDNHHYLNRGKNAYPRSPQKRIRNGVTYQKIRISECGFSRVEDSRREQVGFSQKRLVPMLAVISKSSRIAPVPKK